MHIEMEQNTNSENGMAKKQKTKRTAQNIEPKKTEVFMYDVGFGDCFLVKFSYQNDKPRSVLIDCGTSNKTKAYLAKIIDKIAEDCEGKLEAVVCTHRHKDHLYAFGLKGFDKKFKALKPELVIHPWTEHPDAEKAALKAPSVFTKEAVQYMMSLTSAQQVAQQLIDDGNRILHAAGPRIRRSLAKIASLSIPNKKAIKGLLSLSGNHAYVHTGSPSGLEELLPGVKVSVLGPPTLEQFRAIKRQTRWNPDEFWKLHSSLMQACSTNIASRAGKSLMFKDAATKSIGRVPSHTKWVIQKLDNIQTANIKRIVRIMDDAMNNTSVILLFEVGNKSLLFSGDAQLENWQYALSDKEICKKLKKTSLYKVGHHGSTNATPKSLWALFKKRNLQRNRLVSLLSTEKGHHNKVPRKSLVDALKKETQFKSTDEWRYNKIYESIEL